MNNKKFILIFTLLFCVFGFTNLYAATDITKIEVNMPVPVIGEKITELSDVTVKADDSISFEMLELTWYTYNGTSKQYEELTDANAKFLSGGQYAALIEYKRPNEYSINPQTISVTVNENAIDATDFNSFNYGSWGDDNFEYDGIFYEFGNPQIQKELSQIGITVPTPVVGQIPADKERVTVIADTDLKFEMLELTWYKYNETSKVYEEWTNTSDGFKEDEKYQVRFSYIRPSQYAVNSQTISVTVNGKAIDATNINEFYCGSWGDAESEYDTVTYEFGNPQAQKEINKIEISLPAPVIGEIPVDKAKVTVKADDSISFEMLEIIWYKYNSASQKYEEWTNTSEGFKKGEKYAVRVGYKRPNQYVISKTINVTVNGKAIDATNIEEFYCGSWGDVDSEYDYAYYEFGEVSENITTENTTENSGELENPQTGDNIMIYTIVFLSTATILVLYTVKNLKNKKLEIK